MSHEIHCSHCNRPLLTVPDNASSGTVAALVSQAGFYPKNPILYTGKSEWLNFCSLECSRFYYLDILKVPQEVLDKGRETAKEVRAQMPAFSSRVADHMDRLSRALNSLRKR